MYMGYTPHYHCNFLSEVVLTYLLTYLLPFHTGCARNVTSVCSSRYREPLEALVGCDCFFDDPFLLLSSIDGVGMMTLATVQLGSLRGTHLENPSGIISGVHK